MDPLKEAQELLTLCQEEQRLLAGLYQTYAERFPQCNLSWSEFAQDALRDGELCAELQERRFDYAPGGLHVKGMKAYLETLRANIEQGWRSPRSLDHALELATKVERNLLSRSLFASLSSDDPRLREEFRRLSKPTSEHAKQLRQAILRRNKYLGLVERGLLAAEDLERAQEQARSLQAPVSRVLLTQFGVAKSDLAKHLREFFGVPCYQFGVDPAPPAELIKDLASLRSVFVRDRFVPVALEEDELVVAVEDPKDVQQRDRVSAAFEKRRRVRLCVSTPDDVHAAIERYYSPREAPQDSLGEAIEELASASEGPEEERESLASQEDTAVVRLVNRLIEDAVTRGASDIHIEPSNREPVQVRLRIDGELIKTVEIPQQLRRVVIARLKIMAGLDIAERRKPQSGKISFREWGKLDIELRLEIYPTVAGEDAVLRILTEKEVRTLSDLKLLPDTEETFRELLESPYGLLLCVGPTGSGKTTTLHSALSHLLGDNKILTVEDPVEITQEGLRQVQVNVKAGLTFAVALRSFLRADPDVVMVGEMRDLETASIAVASSLTGHLVLSTLHTNNAPETVTRLIDMGLDRFTFSDSLLGVLAQRLVRGLCEACAVEAPIAPDAAASLAEDYGDPAALERLLAAKGRRWKVAGPGCPKCSGRGFRGRLGVHELMRVDDGMRRSICQGVSARELREAAKAARMRTLRQDGIEKVLAGWTTLEEVHAATSR